jgi:hypothetical protein
VFKSLRTGLGADLLFSESSSLLSAIRYCRSASQNIVTLVVGNACTTLSHGAGAHSRAQGAEMHGPFGTAVHSVPFKSPVTTLTVSDFGCSNRSAAHGHAGGEGRRDKLVPPAAPTLALGRPAERRTR